MVCLSSIIFHGLLQMGASSMKWVQAVANGCKATEMGASPAKWVQGLHNYVHTQHTYAWVVYGEKIAEGVPHGKSRRCLSPPARRFVGGAGLCGWIARFQQAYSLSRHNPGGDIFGKKKI